MKEAKHNRNESKDLEPVQLPTTRETQSESTEVKVANVGSQSKKVAFVRSYVPDLDSRMNKFFGSLERRGVSWVFFGWERGVSGTRTSQRHLLKTNDRVGGKWKSSFGYIRWYLYLSVQMIKRRKEIEVVHCVDLDAALICILYSKLLGKHLIFDIYDNYSSSRKIKGGVSRLLDFLEKKIARAADVSLIAAPERIEQHGLSGNANVVVIENVPVQVRVPSQQTANAKKLIIGYFGVMEECDRGIENLLRLTNVNPNLELRIAGYGPLQPHVEQISQERRNINYYGPLTWTDGMALMGSVNVIAGLYYSANRNHKYAAPNKYYEAMMLGRPLLTSIGTPPGARVVKLQTGWAVGDDFDDLQVWLDNLDIENVHRLGRNARNVWEKKYKNYFEEVYVRRYGNIVTKLMEKL